MPVGTPLFAMVDGTITTAIGNAGIYPASGGRCGNTVIIAGTDGATYTYCHLSTVAVTAGDDRHRRTGHRPQRRPTRHPGAGNTTGPHLHLGIRAYGRAVCPQPLLLAILRGTPIPPTAAPTSGCYHPGPSTDWPTWLDHALAPERPTTAVERSPRVRSRARRAAERTHRITKRTQETSKWRRRSMTTRT